MTQITAPRPEEYSFHFENLPSSTSVVSLKSIENMADGTEVIVKGIVNSIGEPYMTGASSLRSFAWRQHRCGKVQLVGKLYSKV